MENRKQTLTKPNAALVMVPRLGKLTPISRKLYNVILYQTQIQGREIERDGGVIPAKSMFSASLASMAYAFTSGDSKPRMLAKKYFLEMKRTEVDWEAPDTESGVVWRSMGLLSEIAQSIDKSGEIWVHWMLPPSLLTLVMDPGNSYTPINLQYMAKLRSYTAIALYEICIRFRNNPKHLTSSNPPEWWVEALTQEPAPIDPATGQRKRREWRKLKSASVMAAMDEIEEHTDIKLELIEKNFGGKAVKEIQFLIHKKTIEGDQAIQLPSVSATLAEHASRVGISIDVLTSFLQSGNSEAEIKFALGRFESRLQDSGLSEIENKPAYLRSILNEVSGRIKPDQLTTPSAKPLQTVSQVLPWVDQRWADAKTEFLALFKSDQNAFTATALQILREKGHANATMIRKVEEGELPTGALLHKAVEAYAIAAYGSNWLVEPEATQTTNQGETV